MNVKKNIKKNKKTLIKKQVNVKESEQPPKGGTKEWLLASVPKIEKSALNGLRENENIKYASLMDNLKQLTLHELKSMLQKNMLKNGNGKADLVKKVYFGILDGVPQCPMCGERNLQELFPRRLHYCRLCYINVYEKHKVEWNF